MTSQAELDGQRDRVNLLKFFTVAYLRRALLVSIVLQLAQQLTGIGGVSEGEGGGREREGEGEREREKEREREREREGEGGRERERARK